jgi:hypothetical protein
MYEHDGLAGSPYLVLELDTVKHCAIHGTSSSLWCAPGFLRHAGRRRDEQDQDAGRCDTSQVRVLHFVGYGGLGRIMA